jgi:hypothetical protein
MVWIGSNNGQTPTYFSSDTIDIAANGDPTWWNLTVIMDFYVYIIIESREDCRNIRGCRGIPYCWVLARDLSHILCWNVR